MFSILCFTQQQAREREHARLREREMREDERRREREMFRQKEIHRQQRDEAMRLERERHQLRIEKEKLAREKVEIMRQEREKARLERERIEREREALRRRDQINRMDNRPQHGTKRPFEGRREGDPYREHKRPAGVPSRFESSGGGRDRLPVGGSRDRVAVGGGRGGDSFDRVDRRGNDRRDGSDFNDNMRRREQGEVHDRDDRRFVFFSHYFLKLPRASFRHFKRNGAW